MEKKKWNITKRNEFQNFVEEDLTDVIMSMPQIGYQNEKGVTVLPAEYDDPEDSVYDEL